MKLEEARCKSCNKLLGKVKGEAEIKCPRCRTLNSYKK
jgi:LSD1 subclass zinc finger protein